MTFITLLVAPGGATIWVNVAKIVGFYPIEGEEGLTAIWVDAPQRPLAVKHTPDEIEELIREAGAAPTGWTVHHRTSA